MVNRLFTLEYELSEYLLILIHVAAFVSIIKLCIQSQIR